MLGVYTGGCILLPCTRLPGHHMLLHPLNLTDGSELGRTTEPLPRFDRRQLSAAPRIWFLAIVQKTGLLLVRLAGAFLNHGQ